MKANKILPGNYRFLKLFRYGSAGNRVLEVGDFAADRALHPSNQFLGYGMVAHASSICLFFLPACAALLRAAANETSIFRSLSGNRASRDMPFLR
jgi:hypothetical protein